MRDFAHILATSLGGSVVEEPANLSPQSPVFRALIPGRFGAIQLLAYSRTLQFFTKEARSPKSLSNRSDSFIVIGVEELEVSPLTFEVFSCRVLLAVVTMRPSGGIWDLPEYTLGQSITTAAYTLVGPAAYYVSVKENPNPGEVTDYVTQRYDLEILFEVSSLYPYKGGS